MKLREILKSLANAIAEEAERNPKFEAKIWEVFGSSEDFRADSSSRNRAQSSQSKMSRGRHRRPAAVLDPVQVVQEGEQALRDQLSSLTVEQLKDVVADYGMDPSKRAMRWRRPDRITNYIIEVSLARSRKGDAFRS